jgi:hypothetical protein
VSPHVYYINKGLFDNIKLITKYDFIEELYIIVCFYFQYGPAFFTCLNSNLVFSSQNILHRVFLFYP